MDGTFGIVDWLFRSIGWLKEQRSKGEPPRWVIPALVLPIAAGVIAGWVRGNGVFLVLLFGAFGFLLSVGILWLYVNMRQVAGGCSKESTIRQMTIEQLLTLWSSGHSQRWTDEDFEVMEETLRARGVEIPERQ
jgi:hypothetical protein